MHEHTSMTDFDPDAALTNEKALFGLPHTREQARAIVTPAVFDGTTSYNPGTMLGPRAVLEASHQLDLLDPYFGPVYEHGIFLEDPEPWAHDVARRARELARPIIEAGGPRPEDAKAHEELERLCEEVEGYVRGRVYNTLHQGKLPVVLGGEHAVSIGAIEECARFATEHMGATDIGILQIDAHRDLRDAYLGMTRSHASVMRLALERCPAVTRLVQVGIRDAGVRETAYANDMGERVVTCAAADWHRRLDDGTNFSLLASEAIDPLPKHVYVTFDIDGLDPTYCPNTGTPVPGGLSYDRAMRLLQILAESGRTVVGCDLVEVAPGPAGNEWDGNVGARVLYGLIGCALANRS